MDGDAGLPAEPFGKKPSQCFLPWAPAPLSDLQRLGSGNGQAVGQRHPSQTIEMTIQLPFIYSF